MPEGDGTGEFRDARRAPAQPARLDAGFPGFPSAAGTASASVEGALSGAGHAVVTGRFVRRWPQDAPLACLRPGEDSRGNTMLGRTGACVGGQLGL